MIPPKIDSVFIVGIREPDTFLGTRLLSLACDDTIFIGEFGLIVKSYNHDEAKTSDKSVECRPPIFQPLLLASSTKHNRDQSKDDKCKKNCFTDHQ